MSQQKPRKAHAPTPEPVNATVLEERLLRLAEVCQMVALGKTSIYNQIKGGKFPPQTKHGIRASLWRLSDVQAYIRGDWKPIHASSPVLQLIYKKGGANNG